MRANGARGGVAPPRTATDVEYCCCLVSAADDRRARDRVATLATAEFMVRSCFCCLAGMGTGRGLPVRRDSHLDLVPTVDVISIHLIL